jgi:hypothetical protein
MGWRWGRRSCRCSSITAPSWTLGIGSRDTIHKLAGVNWRAIDYADGLVRVGVSPRSASGDLGAAPQAHDGARLKVRRRAYARVDLHHRYLPARGPGERARRRGRHTQSMISR